MVGEAADDEPDGLAPDELALLAFLERVENGD